MMSSSEDENILITRKVNRSAVVDSDSDDDSVSENNQKTVQSEDNGSVTEDNEKGELDDSMDSEQEHSEEIHEQESTTATEKVPFTYNSDIYDADGSSDDEDARNRSMERSFDLEENAFPEDVTEERDNVLKSKGVQKKDKEKKQKKKKEKAPSSSDNMHEIRRESQRMLRESSCILPYHRPKQRTLRDFLNRRKAAPSIPLKTSVEKLFSLGKQIEQMEKQSEEFFKSDDSDSDDEYVLPSSKKSYSNDENVKTDNNTECSTIEAKDQIEIKVSEPEEPIKVTEIEKVELEVNTCEKIANNIEEGVQDKVSCDEANDFPLNESDKNATNMKDTEFNFMLKLSEGNELPNSESIEVEMDLENQNNNEKLPQESEEFSFKLALTEDTQDVECNDSEINDIDSKISTTENINVDKKNEPSWLKSALEYMNDKELNGEADTFTKDKDSKEVELNGNSDKDSEKNNGGESRVKQKNSIFSKLSRLNIDLNKVPKLSGSSNKEINLDSTPEPSAILDFKERFYRHFTMENKKKTVKNPVEISIITTEKDAKGAVNNIKHDKIETTGKHEEQWVEYVKEAQQPGEKLSRLKAHLEAQMKARWKEEFDKRIQQYKMNEEETVDDDAKSDYEADALLEDENEEDMTETESEEEEDDIKLVDKKRPQSQFLDDEAEVSEDEECEEGDEDNTEEEKEDMEDLLGGDEEETDDEKDRKERRNKEKEGNEEEDDELDEDGYLPAYQPHKKENKMENEEKCDSEDEDTQFISPVLRLSGLEGKVQSFSERYSMTPDVSSQILTQNSQSAETQLGLSGLIGKDPANGELSQTDILDLCSGTFPSQPVGWSQLEDCDKSSNLESLNDEMSQMDDESQDFSLSLPEDSQDNFKLTDDFSAKPSIRKPQNKGRILYSDDEEDNAVELNSEMKPKKLNKIKYSDDEDGSDDDAIENDEESEDDLAENNTDLIENEAEEAEEDGEREIEYDSEENEIEVIKDGKSYLENEAELSESDWDSADEDEKDLDNFEREEGDDENLDQDKINRELGKIHMQHVLADDKRDVRALQELLLEDGELHSDGNGRVRQFRWANADADDGISTAKGSDDENSDQEEDEDDEKWRKIRHEREMFLQKQSAKLKDLGIDEDILEDKDQDEEGSFLKMGRAILQKMKKTAPNVGPVQGKQKTLLNGSSNLVTVKHGSFLASGSNYLSRLATITAKMNTDGNVNGPKNSRNFVFSVVSPPKEPPPQDETELKKAKKRKAEEKIESTKKKVHFNDGGNENGQQRKSLFELLAM